MTAAVRRLLVGGTAGGVGTTTITALVFTTVRDRTGAGPTLLDHTAGDLGARLADGDEVSRVDDRLELTDLGPRALDVGVAELADPAVVLTMVSAATPVGVGLAAAGVQSVQHAHGPAGLARTVVVLVGVHGRHRLARPLAPLVASAHLRGVVVVPPDLAIAAGGRIPSSRTRPGTRRALDDLVELLHAGRRAQPASWSWSLPG